VPYQDDPFSILRYRVVDGIHQPRWFDDVPEQRQLGYNAVKVFTIAVEDSADVLEKENLGLKALDGSDKYREAVAVIGSLLIFRPTLYGWQGGPLTTTAASGSGVRS
jgi:hypothetical protein